ncbi:hypothetical protein BpHYR1_038073 [Brachionus plicatilis]|uniref:Uncharacterized protein n=1 Tax=Brachionus plicatilis TaxID=10195 RepID=A0A3M7R4Y4_BRAPC|nr:hypothetical protein BpHYR1_038073 [Brachionus plicatilis]
MTHTNFKYFSKNANGVSCCVKKKTTKNELMSKFIDINIVHNRLNYVQWCSGFNFTPEKY